MKNKTMSAVTRRTGKEYVLIKVYYPPWTAG
jgi:hypothetical protein